MRNLNWESEFTKVLRETYATHRQTNSRFSLRAFAKKIGVSSGTLSDIINSKKTWKLRPERAAQILIKLNLRNHAHNRLLVKMGLPPVHTEHALPEANFQILTDWVYQPILCAFSLPLKERSAKAITKKLGISEKKVNEVIEDALARGFLIKNREGQIERPAEYLKTSDGIPSKVIQMHHQTNIQLAEKSLATQPPESRDFTSLTFVGSKKQIDLLRKEIRDLYMKASTIMSGDSDDAEVYRLSAQLFPMDFRNENSDSSN